MNYLKPNFVETKNNKNILIDTAHQDRAYKQTEKLIKSRAYDPEPARLMKVRVPIFSSIALVVSACSHTGGSGVNDIRGEKAVEWVNQTSNAYFIDAGDSLDVIGGVTKGTHSKVNNQRALEYKIKTYYPIAKSGKLVAILGGNHDGEWGNRNKDNQADFTKHLADALRVPHANFSLVLDFEMATSDFARQISDIVIAVTHMSGRGSGKAKNAEKTEELLIERAAQRGFVPDVAFGGHYHANSGNQKEVTVPVYARNGKLVAMVKHKITTISESTLQENAHYGVAAGYSAVDSNVYFNNITKVRNPLYTQSNKNIQPEYIVEISRVPMFRENSTEYTEEAQAYLDEYREPTHLLEEIKKEYGDLSVNESMEILESMFTGKTAKEFLVKNGEIEAEKVEEKTL